MVLAEREGFEPSVPRKEDNGFRDRPVRPLRHLSIPAAARTYHERIKNIKRTKRGIGTRFGTPDYYGPDLAVAFIAASIADAAAASVFVNACA